MLIGIDIRETKEFVSETDKTDNPTVFLIGNLPNSFKLSVLGSIIQSDGKPDVRAVQNRAPEIVRAGLKGIRNFYDSEKKQPVEVKAADLTDQFMEMIPVAVLYELAGKILEFNFVSETEAKN